MVEVSSPGSSAPPRREMVWVRIASGVVLSLFALTATLVGGWPFNVIIATAGVLMAYEWDRLCGGPAFGLFGGLQSAAIVVAVALTGSGRVGAALAVAMLAAAGIALLARRRGRDARWIAGGMLYISIPVIATVWLRGNEDWGRLAVLGLFAVIWATDTGAYFTGRTIGGPRLAPRISPGKTWSGLWGGVASATIAALIVGHFAALHPLWLVGLAGALLSLVGQIGDLGKSKVKRHFHVKDSGNLIPGHGGIIDRLDSTLATMPLLAIALAIWL